MKRTIVLSFFTLSFFNLFTLYSQDDLTASKERGKELYLGYCITCHMDQGQGIEGVFPPLAESDYMMADKKRSIRTVKFGMEGEITVNGVVYNNIMTSMGLDDQEVADVLNYIRNSWGNEGEPVTSKEVTKVN